MNTIKYFNLKLQTLLVRIGYYNGKIDGIIGPISGAAIKAFKKDHGLKVSIKIDDELIEVAEGVAGRSPDWMLDMYKMIGKHERHDRFALQDWLSSSSQPVDPLITPWCGVAIDACFRNTGVNPDDLPGNPALAINWLKFGHSADEATIGSILVFWRGYPQSWKGHVGFYVGESDKYYYVLGGNQSNRVSVTRIGKHRLKANGIRWPNGVVRHTERVVKREDKIKVTKNEA